MAVAQKPVQVRMNKLERMTPEQRIAAARIFWESPADAPFPPEVVALVCNRSMQWLQVQRTTGGGIPFMKSGLRKVMYQKSDVLDFMHTAKLASTSMQPSQHTTKISGQ